MYLYVALGGIVAAVTLSCWAVCTRCGGLCGNNNNMLTAMPEKRRGVLLLENDDPLVRLSLASPDGRRRSRMREQTIGSPSPNKVAPLAIELNPSSDMEVEGGTRGARGAPSGVLETA